MTTDQISAFIADSIQIGYMTAVKAYEPLADELKQSELKTWCQATFTDYKKLRRLIRAGLVTPYRRGDSKNSPLVYSKADIKRAIITNRLSLYITEEQMKQDRVNHK